MNTNMKIAGALAVTLLVAGCSSKPQTAAQTDTSGIDSSQTGGSAIPGSEEDLKQNVGDRVFFELDHSDLSQEARQTLDRQAAWLKRYPAVRVTLEGHCDERGTREYNMALGARRANAARSYLVALGIQSVRIQTVSYGAERPAVLGTGEAVWSQNRRAVTVVAQAGS
ncbi:MAG TPA: peptidoglycan-associated lipoprotein Pal [Alphaproteobacteria bacterium]|nr:peptidoglycan-associated lipoprotein Pal [Alphaproteobacteria bacterium]